VQHLAIAPSSLTVLALLVFPGLPIALFSRSRPSLWTVLGDAVLWSVVLDTAIIWLPLLRGIRLDAWCWVLLGMCLLGLLSCVVARQKLQAGRAESARPCVPDVASCILLAFFVVVALVRPNIDWDSVNYYLAAAVGFAAANQITVSLPSALTIAHHPPLASPPLMPALYAIAVEVATLLHITADQSVRWIPLAFLIGTWVGVRRLAQGLLPAPYPACAATLWLALPATIQYMTFNPLYVDLPLTFLIVSLFAEAVHSPDTGAWVSGLRAGLTCTLLLLTKVTGPVILAVSLLVVVCFRLGGWRARLLYVVSLALAGLVGWRLGLLAVEANWVWGTAAAAAALYVWHAIPRRADIGLPSRSWAAAAAMGVVPGIWAYLTRAHAVGTPMAFYAPALTHLNAPHWEWAWKTIRSLGVFDAVAPPGTVSNAPWGLLLWWGFAPLTNLVALFAMVASLRAGSRLNALGAIWWLYVLAWLSVFHSAGFQNAFQFREFIPLSFIEALFAAQGLQRLSAWSRVAPQWWALILLLCEVPFAWMAQETFFRVPAILGRIHFMQWFALSNAMLAEIGMFLVVAGAAIALFTVCARRTATPARHDLNPVLPLCLVGALVFEPVAATGMTPGFSVQYEHVRNTTFYGYLPALDAALGDDAGRSLLTFVGYGVTWYSVGRVRPLDLTDALTLGALRGVFERDNPREILERLRHYGAVEAIVPAADGTYAPQWDRLRRDHGMRGLEIFDDPLLSWGARSGDWVRRVFDPPSVPAPQLPHLRIYIGAHQVVEADARWDRPRRTEGVLSKMPSLVSTTPAATEIAVIAQWCAFRTWCNQAWQRRNLSVRVPSAGVDLAASALVRTFASTKPADMATLWVRSIVADVRMHDKPSKVVDWRSPGFGIDVDRHRISLDSHSLPFTPFPELAPIASVGINLPQQRVVIYPVIDGLAEGVTDTGFWVETREDSLCPHGTPLSLFLTVTAEGGTYRPTTWVVRATAPAGETIRLRFPRGLQMAFARANSIAIRGLVAAGKTPGCRVREDIADGAITFVRNGSFWVVRPAASPLKLAQLTLPVGSKTRMQPVP
jgi:hypothetical protein